MTGLGRHAYLDRIGRALVISGRDGATLHESLESTPLDGYGLALRFIGDVNSDGHADLALGEPDFRLPDPGTGAAMDGD